MINRIKKLKRRVAKNIERYFFALRKADTLTKTWLKNRHGLFTYQTNNREKVSESMRENIILRWFVTSWCNYRCPYCTQDHSRVRGRHAFDWAEHDKWINKFDYHFGKRDCNLLLTMTGGEPLLDIKNMRLFLDKLLRRKYLLNIRIDTNLSWAVKSYKELPCKDKIWLMCTFHPSQAAYRDFINKIREVEKIGFNIGIVNYVFTGDGDFECKVKDFYKIGLPLHPNPLWNSEGKYTTCDINTLKKYLPEQDFLYRTALEAPFGKRCLFPAIGYEMNCQGQIRIACHGDLGYSNFLKQTRFPKRFNGYTRCPHQKCMCLEKYSFLENFGRNYSLNPLAAYKVQLLKRYKRIIADNQFL